MVGGGGEGGVDKNNRTGIVDNNFYRTGPRGQKRRIDTEHKLRVRFNLIADVI